VDVTGSKSLRILTENIKLSLHSQPHCATTTCFHDYLSIVSGRVRSQTFQKMKFTETSSEEKRRGECGCAL
jgi:hypothetical protein